MTSQTERYALITGASSGIGRATALAFAQAGIHLALVSRTQSKLEAVAAAATQYGVEVRCYPVDLLQVEHVREKIAAIATGFGPLDILVNNAGMGYTAMLSDTPLVDWQRVLTVALSKTLAAEERQHGIRVVTISPGSVNTPLWDTDTVHADFDRASMLTPETVAQSILYTALLPQEAVVEELTLMPNAGTF